MSVESIERAHAMLGFTYAEIAGALHVDESTVHRWRSGLERQRASAGARKVAALAHLMDLLDVRTGGDQKRMAEWLDSPHSACDDRTPREWLRGGRADYLAGLLAGMTDLTSVPVATGPAVPPGSTDRSMLATSFDQAPVGLAVVGLGGEFLVVNARLCDILGYHKHELEGMRFPDLTHADDLAADLDLTLKLLSGAIPSYTFQKRYIRKDGRVIWSRLSGTVVRDAAGAPQHFLASIDPLPDIEAAAIRLALGRAPGAEDAREGVWEWDVASGQIYCGPQIATVLGRSTDEVPATLDAFQALVHPDDRDTRLEALQRYVSGAARTFDIEFRMAHADGGWRWIHSRGRALSRDQDGRTTRMAGLHSEVTERHEASARLAASRAELDESDARFRALLESASHVLWTTDAEGNNTTPSETWQAFSGQTAEQARNSGWASAIHPDDRETTLRQWKTAVANRRPFAIVHRVRRHDGEYRLMVARGAPVRDAAGTMVEWVGTHTDLGDGERYRTVTESADHGR